MGDDLHWQSSKFGNDLGVIFGLHGLPPVHVNGERASRFWDCDSNVNRLAEVTQAVCSAYTGSTKPIGCDATLEASARSPSAQQ